MPRQASRGTSRRLVPLFEGGGRRGDKTCSNWICCGTTSEWICSWIRDHEIKQTPVRKRMVQVRNFVINAQNGLKETEAEADGYAGKIQKVQGELKVLSAAWRRRSGVRRTGRGGRHGPGESARKQASVLNNNSPRRSELQRGHPRDGEMRSAIVPCAQVWCRPRRSSITPEGRRCSSSTSPRVNEIKTRRTQAEEGIDGRCSRNTAKIRKGLRPILHSWT